MNRKITNSLFIAAIYVFAIICVIVVEQANKEPKHLPAWKTLSRPKVVLGLSKIEVKEGSVIATQVDRVARDIAWGDSKFSIERAISPSITSTNDVVPYMEGARVIELINYSGAKIIPITPCRVYKGYAGSFLIDESKLAYASVFRQDSTIVLPDTHGFNMIAQGIDKMTEHPDLAIACMDLPNKAKAAKYLADKGISCYAVCDRFSSDLLSVKTRGTIIGSAPIRDTDQGAVIGNQPMAFATNESIVVQTTSKGYPDQYCDTPARYFTRLNKTYMLDLELESIEAGVGEVYKVVDQAKRAHVNVVGVRVFNRQDAAPLRTWLKQNSSHKAVLFHSAGYEEGYKLFFEFPENVTFGDLQPKVYR